MATFILVDSLNMFARARHVTSTRDVDVKVGMAMHIMFNSIKKSWNDFGGTHVVVCTEGRSWRKDHTPTYKANRALAKAERTQREIEDDELFFEGYNQMIDFFKEKTNCSVAHCPIAEADDLIATWIQTHPNDNHIIVSTDSDFIQLLAPNVKIYNGVTELTYCHDAVYNKKNQKMEFSVDSGGKIKVGKPNPGFEPDPDWIEFALFLKCIRGDKSDHVFPAYPGARIKGSSNKVGITEAFNDRKTKGYAYNNFMLQKWTDHNDEEKRVLDEYNKNRTLIDLTCQPDDIKEQCRESIRTVINNNKVSNVGILFMKFCGMHNLVKLSEQATDMGKILNAGIAEVTMEHP